MKVANLYSARLFMLAGVILMISGIVVYYSSLPNQMGAFSGNILTLLLAVMIVIMTEKHLNRLFDDDGNLIN